MPSPVLQMLQSTALRESRRIDLMLVRTGIVAIFWLTLLPGPWQLLTGPAATGPRALAVFDYESAGLAVVLGELLSATWVQAGPNGHLSLLALTGVSAGQWIRFRLMQVGIGFVSVWIIRLPMLCWIWTLGDLRPNDVLQTELFLLGLSAVVLTAGLCAVSMRAGTGQRALGQLAGLAFGIDYTVRAPQLLLRAADFFWPHPFPDWLRQAADWLAGCSLMVSAQGFGSGSLDVAPLWRPLAFYSAIVGVALFGCWRALPTEMTRDAGDVQAARSTAFRRLNSRRCWDDPLAWQAYHIHNEGRRLVIGKCFAFVLLTLALTGTSWFDRLPVTMSMTIAIVISGVMLLVSSNMPSQCLLAEIKEQTLSTLMLAPLDAQDLFRGWERGRWRLSWPELVFWGGSAAVFFMIRPDFALWTIAIGGAILASGPLMMVSSLAPVSWQGLMTGIPLVTVCVPAVGAAVAAGISNPWLAPVALIPAALLLNWIARKRLLPYWLARRVREEIQ